MKNKSILIAIFVILIIIVAGALYLNFTQQGITGAVIEDNYTMYTKAICNETNYCQDYEITCDKEELINISPVTGAVIQHNPDWEDPRNKETINKICD